MSIQIVIILIYLTGTIAIGLLAIRRTKSAESFHGVQLGIFMCVAAGTGEWLGGTSTTGVSEYGYLFGISGSWYTIANGIGVIFLALFFAKLYRSLDTVTVPGIIEKYIGVNARIVSSILLTFVMMAVGTSQIVAAGTLGVTVFGMDYVTSVMILGTGFIVYTLAGGMVAVGYTNMMHLAAMYGGVLLAIMLTLADVGGMAGLRKALPDSYFSMTAIGIPRVSSWVIASLLGACTAQAGIQPILAARDVTVAKRAAVTTAFVVAPFGILTAILGMAAKVKFPELTNAKQALPTLMMNLNPVAGGIVLASILAAVLSTISPIILASGTMITKDIYQRKWKPGATDKEVLAVSRITTALAGIICMIVAVVLYDSSRILDLVYFAYTLRGSLFVVLLLGIYWKGTNQKGAIAGMVTTSIVGFIWVGWKAAYGAYPIHPDLNETYVAVVTALLSTLIFCSVFRGKSSQVPL